MQNTKGNNLIFWIVMLGDMVVSCLQFSIFSYLQPQYVPTSLLYHTKTSLVVLGLSVIIASMLIPTVIHNRIMSFAEMIRRNAKFVGLLMIIFLVTCRMMSASGNFIVFGVAFALSLLVSLLVVRLVERQVINYFRSKGKNIRCVVFVGSDPANLDVYNKLISDPSTGYRVIGYYSDDAIAGAPEEFVRLGNKEDLHRKMSSGDTYSHIHELYCSLSHSESRYISEVMDFCNKNVIHFYYVPRNFGNIQLSLHAELFDDTIVYTNYHEPLQSMGNKLLKRSFDIAFSSVVLLCMLPFLPIVAFIIKKQSPGPLIFTQERTGFNGQNFLCYKFRSMHVNADADKIQATKDDPRKFPFGNFMRKTNIDEFPQFFNVLKGDMSIVGPRPHMVYHTEKYSALIEKYMVRHFSKPGITGWAQVTGFRGETEELWQMEGRVKKDIWYIEHWSVWLDIKIIFLTAWSIVRPDKAAY